MAEILEFVRQHGRQRAIEEFPDQRDLVEVASRYAADEDSELSFLFSGWCQAALPQKAPRRPDKVWEIGTERVSLIVEPLQRKAADGSWSHAGVPFGSRARLIL